MSDRRKAARQSVATPLQPNDLIVTIALALPALVALCLWAIDRLAEVHVYLHSLPAAVWLVWVVCKQWRM